MTAYALQYNNILEQKKKASSEFFFPGHHILHTETEILQEESKPYNEALSMSILEHNFTLCRNSEIMAWIVLSPRDKRIAELKTRFIGNEVDFNLTEKMHNYIEDFSGRNGWTSLYIYAAPSGIGFYRCLGFEYESATIQDSGMVLYVMKKEI
jgi:hypothetical protein